MPTSSASATATGSSSKKPAAHPPNGKKGVATPITTPTSSTATSYKSATLNSHGYVLGKTLGSGTYGKVKYADSLRHKHPVAIKIVNRRVAKDVHLKFLPRELDALQTLKHENIIGLFEVMETQEHVYIVMELAEGGDLLDYINKHRFLSEDDSKRLFHDLVDGLSECHRLNFVHRDLKCENMLLNKMHRLKISDFGFARRFTESQTLQTYCGSYAYAAPEIIIGEPYLGPTADIWSIGVILYAMVCGKLPFKDKDAKTLLSDVASKLNFPSRINDQCKDLIKKILKFKPKERLTLTQIKSHPWMIHHHDNKQTTSDLPISLPPPIPPRTYRRDSHATCSQTSSPLETVPSNTTLPPPPPLPPRKIKTKKETVESQTQTDE